MSFVVAIIRPQTGSKNSPIRGKYLILLNTHFANG